TILVFCSSEIHWLARPHVFSFLMMIIYHYLLECWQRRDKNRLYLLAPIMLLWVNLHGGFLGGFILLGAYLIGNIVCLLSASPDARSSYTAKVKQISLTIIACL